MGWGSRLRKLRKRTVPKMSNSSVPGEDGNSISLSGMGQKGLMKGRMQMSRYITASL